MHVRGCGAARGMVLTWLLAILLLQEWWVWELMIFMSGECSLLFLLTLMFW